MLKCLIYAYADAKQAITIDANHLKSYYRIAQAIEMMKDYEQAAHYYMICRNLSHDISHITKIKECTEKIELRKKELEEKTKKLQICSRNAKIKWKIFN